MKRIAVTMSKGGVGKTTTTVNLAAALVEMGKRVLVIDGDTQGQVSKFLGVTPSAGLYEFVTGTGGISPGQCVTVARKGLFILTGGRDLLKLRNWLQDRSGDERATILREKLQPKPGTVDIVLYDTAPGWDILAANIMAAVDEVLAPVPLQGAALDGLVNFLDFFRSAKEHNKSLQLKYIVPTMFDRRTKLSPEVMSQLQAAYADRVTDPIHYSVKVAESAGFGKTIFEYDARNVTVEDFRKLARRVCSE